jgi:hypothetical protein
MFVHFQNVEVYNEEIFVIVTYNSARPVFSQLFQISSLRICAIPEPQKLCCLLREISQQMYKPGLAVMQCFT